MVLVWRRTGRVSGCQIYARVAQLVEHLLAKERVAGSSPVSRLTKNLRSLENKTSEVFLWAEKVFCYILIFT